MNSIQYLSYIWADNIHSLWKIYELIPKKRSKETVFLFLFCLFGLYSTCKWNSSFLSFQLPADFSRLHLADGIHPQVTHVSSSLSGCSITSDSGSSSLSDIYQVIPPTFTFHKVFREVKVRFKTTTHSIVSLNGFQVSYLSIPPPNLVISIYPNMCNTSLIRYNLHTRLYHFTCTLLVCIWTRLVLKDQHIIHLNLCCRPT